jgi:alpha-tubulin suppressor-like RCC1 family protein
LVTVLVLILALHGADGPAAEAAPQPSISVAYGWGDNRAGQAGGRDRGLVVEHDPARVPGLSAVATVAAGGDHSLALLNDGTIRAWGSNKSGELGVSSSDTCGWSPYTFSCSYTPLTVPGLNGVVAIAAGDDHSLAVLSDGTVRAWGSNYYGQLGDGTTCDPTTKANCQRSTPVAVPGLGGVVAVAAGHGHSLAVLRDGTVRAWGWGGYGQLGDGTPCVSGAASRCQRSTPVMVSGLSGATAVAGGSRHSLALLGDGTVRAWGSNDTRQLGASTDQTCYDFPCSRTPVAVSTLSGVTAIAAQSSFHNLALLGDGTVRAWGENDNNQLGDGTTIPRSSPVAVSGLSGVTAIAANIRGSRAVLRDGTVRAWGTGTGPTPVTVAGLNGVTAIAMGDQHNLAVATAEAGLAYYPLPRPLRLLDTRPGAQACDAPGAPLMGNSSRTEPARVSCGGITIPASAQAVVGNAAVVNGGSAPGHLTLYPSDAALPVAANLNYEGGQVLSNAFTAGLGGDGAFRIYTSTTVHVVVDIAGYYAPPGPGGLYYHPLPQPLRLLDTRPGQIACDRPATPLAGGASRTQPAIVTDCGQDRITIPPSAQAVVGNAAVVNSSGTPGHITLYPSGAELPVVANLNYVGEQALSNAFTVGLSRDGAFNIYTSTTVHFVADIAGYYSTELTDANGTGLLYHPLPQPLRLLDTRPGQIACDSPGAPLVGDNSRTEPTRVSCGGITIPFDTRVVAGNAAVVNGGSAPGSLTLYVSGDMLPVAANLNYVGGQVLSNAFTVGLSRDGTFRIYASTTVHVVVDLAGYFAP